MLRLCSLDVVKIGNWLIKASSFDDQILISGYNTSTLETFLKMFYNEDVAYIFMEKLYD